MTAALQPQPQKKLQPIPPPSKTWRHIGMDLICDLPESEDGYKYILVTGMLPEQICCSTPSQD